MTWFILLLKYWSRIFDRDEVPLEYPVAEARRRLGWLRGDFDYYDSQRARIQIVRDSLTNRVGGNIK